MRGGAQLVHAVCRPTAARCKTASRHALKGRLAEGPRHC